MSILFQNKLCREETLEQLTIENDLIESMVCSQHGWSDSLESEMP